MISEKAKTYCCEDISTIENYEQAINDDTQTWICHHKNGILLHKTKEELIELGLYKNRPANELIFLTETDHYKLHNSGENNPMYGKQSAMKGKIPWNKGKKTPDDVKRKISDACKGKRAGENNPMYGKQSAMKGKTPWNKGKHWKLVDGKQVYY